MKNPFRKFVFTLIGGTLLIAIISQFIQTSPSDQFLRITGYDVPSGFDILSYNSISNDNLLRKGHFWKFSHSPSDFDTYIKSTNFHISEDAIWMRPGFEKALGPMRPSNIETGYEREGDRDDWILLKKGRQVSYLNVN